MSVVICLPTFNPRITDLNTIRAHTPEKIFDMDVSFSVIDSGSRNFNEIKNIFPNIIQIPAGTFNHGATRNQAASLVKSDYLVFVTQDILPEEDWLANLLEPLINQDITASFGRQLPKAEAPLLESFSRYFNYPNESRERSISDLKSLGIKAFFFSNVCSAVTTEEFWEIGGFPENVIMNEDMMLAAKILRSGRRIKYAAAAKVTHSHNYTLRQQFRRNFDVGAFLADAGPMLAGAHATGEGLRFVREQIRYVSRHGRSDLLPLVFAEAATKFIAFQLGKRHHLLPRRIKKKLSMHSYHWDQQ